MDRPFPLRFELPSPAKCLRVERAHEIEAAEWGKPHTRTIGKNHWRLWLMANGDFTLGTFIQLLDNGKVNRVTWHEDGTESILEVKE